MRRSAANSIGLLVIVSLVVTSPGCGGSGDAVDGPTGGSAEASPSTGGNPPVAKASTERIDRVTPRELHARLKEKNPEYENDAQFGRQEGEIRAVSLRQTAVTDLSPLAGLELRVLDLYQTGVTDLSPLEGMPLVELMADETAIEDIGPLRGMPLKTLWLNGTGVSDLSPLQGMPIEMLNLFGTKVSDLSVLQTLPLNTVWLRDVPAQDFSPLEGLFLESLDVQGTAFGDDDLELIKGMPVARLNIAETDVTDLTPLKNLRLTRLIFTPAHITKGLDVVRSMASLRELDVTFREPKRLTPPEFWAKHDREEFDAPGK